MITLIAAYDEDRVIGVDDRLPWHLPDDLRHFKRVTSGCPVIMGRKTFEGLPFRPLPNRENIVITRGAPLAGAICFDDVRKALDYAQEIAKEAFVIGGQSIYEQTIELADRLLITHVKGTHAGTHFFPEFELGEWVTDEWVTTAEFSIMEYARKG